MANTIPQINANSIQAVNGLGHKPIYFITLQGNTQLVVKGEKFLNAQQGDDNDDAMISIAWSSKIMKNVSPDNREVNSKIMSPQEVMEFKRAARAAFQQGSNEEFHLNVAYNWVKMPKVNHLSDMDYIKVGSDGFTKDDFSKIKKNITLFLDPVHWVNLGKVVAADLFNGNNDRFNKDGEWVNKGNIMFRNGTIIGMDTWDPSGTHGGGLESNLAKGGGDYSVLRPLIDQNARQTFCLTVAGAVGKEFANSMRIANMGKLSFRRPDGTIGSVTQDQMKALFTVFALDFEQGFVAGTQALKNYLQQKVRDYQQKQNQFAQRNQQPVQQQPPQPRFNGMSGHRGGGGNQQQNGFQRAVPNRNLPQNQPMMGNRQHQAQAHGGMVIPQGILDRMQYLGW